MIDVHVLACKPAPGDLEACVDSLLVAIDRSPITVDLHVVNGVDGHIGEGRQHGYSMGRQPWVTYVDQDDTVEPDAFKRIATMLSQAIDVIWCTEQELQNGHVRPGRNDHHLTVFRRELLIDHRNWRVCGDLAQTQALIHRPCATVTEPVYTHRLYTSPGRLLRRQHPDEWRSACG